jgi:hypothetical protein
MAAPADVMIVAGWQDIVANHVQVALTSKGCRVSRCDGMTAARLFTIRVTEIGANVTPDCALFVRQSAWWTQPGEEREQDTDELFLRSEAWSMFWAAAALIKAPVVNRPTWTGLIGRITSGEIAAAMSAKRDPTDQQAGGGSARDLDDDCRSMFGQDIYASSPEFIGDAGEEIWAEGEGQAPGPLSGFDASVPVRARMVDLNALYEIVTVVGTRGFPATTDPVSAELDLARRSIAIAQRFQAHFATVTWSIVGGRAVPIRLNNAPEDLELRYAWPEISEALCEDLLI